MNPSVSKLSLFFSREYHHRNFGACSPLTFGEREELENRTRRGPRTGRKQRDLVGGGATGSRRDPGVSGLVRDAPDICGHIQPGVRRLLRRRRVLRVGALI